MLCVALFGSSFFCPYVCISAFNRPDSMIVVFTLVFEWNAAIWRVSMNKASCFRWQREKSAFYCFLTVSDVAEQTRGLTLQLGLDFLKTLRGLGRGDREEERKRRLARFFWLNPVAKRRVLRSIQTGFQTRCSSSRACGWDNSVKNNPRKCGSFLLCRNKQWPCLKPMVGGGGEVVLMKNSVHDLGLLWDVTALL